MVKLNVGNWLKPDFVVAGNTLATFMTEGEMLLKADTGFDKDVLKVQLKFGDGTEKDWTLNKTSVMNITKAYGSETKNWVGKKVMFSLMQVVIKGVTKQAIIGNPTNT